MKERIFNCPDCGVLVKTTVANKLRCRECAENWHRERAREAQARLQERRKAGIEPKPRDVNEYHDSPENIQKCLNCKLPKCKNCLSYGNQRSKQKTMERRAANG